MKRKVTLKQIAKELGVSVSTVSKALSDSPEISEPTKIKINLQSDPSKVLIVFQKCQTQSVSPQDLPGRATPGDHVLPIKVVHHRLLNFH